MGKGLEYTMVWYEEKTGIWARREIPYEKALDIVLGSWRDTDLVRDMLLRPNRIKCMFSYIEVSKDGMVLQPGLYDQINEDYNYNEKTWCRVGA